MLSGCLDFVFVHCMQNEPSWLFWEIERNNYNLGSKHDDETYVFSGLAGTSGQTPQLFHSQTVTGSTTTALPGNTPLYNTPLTPMTPITPATPASESSGIVPQLQYVFYFIWRFVTKKKNSMLALKVIHKWFILSKEGCPGCLLLLFTKCYTRIFICVCTDTIQTIYLLYRGNSQVTYS